MRGLGLGIDLRRARLSHADAIAADLLRRGDVIDLGALATVTRASAAKDPWTGDDLASGAIRRRFVPLGESGLSVAEVFSEKAVTRINDADLTAWTATGTAAVAAGAQSDYDYRLTLASGDTVYDDRAVTSGVKHFLGLRARKISGDCTGLSAVFCDASDASAWSTVDLSGLTTTWAWYGDATAATDDTDGRVIITAGAGCVIEVQYVQLTEGAAAAAYRNIFVPGAGAGVVGAVEQVDVAGVAWAAPRSLILGLTHYSRPTSAAESDYRIWVNNSSLIVRRSAANYLFAPATGSTTAARVAADTRGVYGCSWDSDANSTIVYAGGSVANTTTAAAVTPATVTVRLGSRSGNEPYSGALIALYATRVLTPGEMTAISLALGHGTVTAWRA